MTQAHIQFDPATGKLTMDTTLSILDTEAIYKWGARIILDERVRIITGINDFQKLPAAEQTQERFIAIFEGESNGEK